MTDNWEKLCLLLAVFPLKIFPGASVSIVALIVLINSLVPNRLGTRLTSRDHCTCSWSSIARANLGPLF